jgi:hypothetical protein
VDNLVIDISECFYIDPEGVRWLAAAKAEHQVDFVDRRTGQDRRDLEAAASRDRREGEDRRNLEAAASYERREGADRRALRRRKRDRRQRSEF